MKCAYAAEESGWKLDLDLAKDCVAKLKAEQDEKITELKTVECSFCSVEYEQHKSSKSKFCSDFCRKSARKFKE